MLVRIDEARRPLMEAFLAQEPYLNLHILGDLRLWGTGRRFFELWGEWREGRYVAAVSRYYSTIGLWTPPGTSVPGFTMLMRGWRDRTHLSGPRGHLDAFSPYFNWRSRERFQFAVLPAGSLLPAPPPFPADLRLRWAMPTDAPAICRLRGMISEFNTGFNLDGVRWTLETGATRTLMLEREGQLVSAASLSDESRQAAMIVTVMTDPGLRRRGYAALTMNALCREVLLRGKALCLMYNNPIAERLYRKLGFCPIGEWEKITLS